MSRTPDAYCRVCDARELTPSLDFHQVPVHCNVQWSTREQALQAPRATIRLACCRSCGHVFNEAFEPQRVSYDSSYENSLHFSPRFRSYAESLANRLVEKYDVRNRTVIEIGCGRGDFLDLLCRTGNNKGYGFDPSLDEAEMDSDRSKSIVFIKDFYSSKYERYQGHLVCCRQVLEHMPRPLAFLRELRRTICDHQDTMVYFEVPNVLFTLRALGIWDVIYEHCSYFSTVSLAAAFKLSGFSIVDLYEDFDGQYLGIEARLSPGQRDSHWSGPETAEDIVKDFLVLEKKYRRKVEEWDGFLRDARHKGEKVVVWGAGSKGVTFLNVLKPEGIDYVVDLNPRKQGLRVAGTAQKIVPAEFLRAYRPDHIIVMNSIYGDEIRDKLRALSVPVKLAFA